ncbi:unnamed protein product [Rotaria magnacalcarata]|uniref:DNA polymerase epsilon catalytic subunit n=1 Tax=Rotaria magnacalcarata TaxID=392030 RepID=A0A819VBE9_9BILA|nr:unnamed protein product [Rotaria magnacalcarata]
MKNKLYLPNHLAGIKRTFIRLRFHDIDHLMKARKELQPIVKRNIEQQIDGIIELREFDIPYHSRETLHFLNIIRYDVRVEQPELIILAFDFECTKMRLKFPTHASDQIKLRQKNQ